MKKLLYIAFALVLGLCGCSEDRSQYLKVYNWADYIDEDLIDEFEVWYEEQTGEKVEIIYQTFDINETMLSKIELGHEDYDVVCPSDYIIERMLKNDLLLPLNKDFGDTPNYLDNVAPFMNEKMGEIEEGGRNANDYSVAYMWGTVGLIYNPKYIPDQEAASWEVLRNPAYSGKVLMKDAFRDVYTAFLVALNREALNSGEKDIETLTYDTSDESIALVESYLNSFRESVCGWEADFGKEQMTKELAWINLSWSGDAQWAIDEAATIGMDLRYSIPDEGSVIWFDGWVIPKYAKNVKAANYFINFMCKSENALRNMDEIGYVSVVASPDILEAKIDSTLEVYSDLTYFFGEGADSVPVDNIQYPDRAVIERSALMRDCGSRTKSMIEMWSRVKGDSLAPWVYIVIGITFGGGSIWYVYNKVQEYKRRAKYKKNKRKANGKK